MLGEKNFDKDFDYEKAKKEADIDFTSKNYING
jgi:hypothetical protein